MPIIRLLFKPIIFCLIVSNAFSQSASCPETVTLPTDSKWGGGDVQGSILIGNTYGPGQGPGIYIVADGGYRLYLNNELLAYDNAAGRVQFIPMTFLPGNNALSVVGINGKDAPGVLIQIDELEKSYYSGSSWKTNANPADNTWKNKNYNDASWSSATIQSTGSLTQTPSGVTFDGFPSTSQSKWIWSSSSSNQQSILRFVWKIKAVGYGAATNGGEDAKIIVITSKQQFLDHIQTAGKEILLIPEGTYDFREFKDQVVCNIPCNSTLPTYKGNATTGVGNCAGTEKTLQRWDKLIWIKSNKSIIGMGRGASLRGGSFYSGGGQSNIIFRNLKIWDINPHIIEANDGIGGYELNNLWVDHCTFKWISDGNDQGDANQTWSWNMVDGLNEFMCSGHDHYAMAIGRCNITFDHVYWYECEGRDPDAAEYNKIHIINNYHENNKYYVVGGLKYSEILVEGSVFDNVSQPIGVSDNAKLYQRNNQFNNCGPFNKDGKTVSDLKDAVFTPPYSFTVENTSTVANNVKTNSGCGGRWKNPLSYGDSESRVSAGPTVSISSPANNYEFSSKNPVAVTVNASGATKVELYLGNSKIGEDASSPYTFNLTGLLSCNYSIRAVAYDSRGVVSYSVPVLIKGTTDCNGVQNGSAYLDECGICVSGNTGKTACYIDCNGDRDGTAILDYCGICSGGNTGVTACTDMLQGENFCEADGVTESKNAGFLDTAYVNFNNNIGSFGHWYLVADQATTLQLGIRYANSGATARSMAIYVNGTQQTTLIAPPTGSWTTWKIEYVTLNLAVGSNQITTTSTTSDGGPNIDLFTFSNNGVHAGGCTVDCNGVLGGTAYRDQCKDCIGGNTGKDACTQDCEGNWGGSAYLDDCNICISTTNGNVACFGFIEAETACSVDGIQLEDKNAGFSGEGYVNADNIIGAAVTWNIVSNADQTATLAFRYANSGTSSRDGDLYINGTKVINLKLPPTGAWTIWEMASVNVSLATGANEISLKATTADGLANIDLISFSDGVSEGICIITGNVSGSNTELTIYPNPTQNRVFWNTEKEWILLDLQGKEKAKGKGKGKSTDLSNFSNGVYLLKIDQTVSKVFKN